MQNIGFLVTTLVKNLLFTTPDFKPATIACLFDLYFNVLQIFYLFLFTYEQFLIQ